MPDLRPAAPPTALHIDALRFKRAAQVVRVVNHHLRQRILHLLHLQGDMAVTELYTQLKLEQSVASQHLGALRRAGFVRARRDGKFVYYSVDYRRLHDVGQLCQDIIPLRS